MGHGFLVTRAYAWGIASAIVGSCDIVLGEMDEHGSQE
jgi:hypothetical protein